MTTGEKQNNQKRRYNGRNRLIGGSRDKPKMSQCISVQGGRQQKIKYMIFSLNAIAHDPQKIQCCRPPCTDAKKEKFVGPIKAKESEIYSKLEWRKG